MTGHTLTRLALRSATVGYVLCLIVLPLAGIGWQSFADGWVALSTISATTSRKRHWS